MKVDSNASASGAQPPEARRPWEPGCEAKSNPSPSAKLKASPKGGAFSLVEGEGDSNASASGTGRPEANRPWKIGWPSQRTVALGDQGESLSLRHM